MTFDKVLKEIDLSNRLNLGAVGHKMCVLETLALFKLKFYQSFPIFTRKIRSFRREKTEFRFVNGLLSRGRSCLPANMVRATYFTIKFLFIQEKVS